MCMCVRLCVRLVSELVSQRARIMEDELQHLPRVGCFVAQEDPGGDGSSGWCWVPGDRAAPAAPRSVHCNV